MSTKEPFCEPQPVLKFPFGGKSASLVAKTSYSDLFRPKTHTKPPPPVQIDALKSPWKHVEPSALFSGENVLLFRSITAACVETFPQHKDDRGALMMIFSSLDFSRKNLPDSWDRRKKVQIRLDDKSVCLCLYVQPSRMMTGHFQEVSVETLLPVLLSARDRLVSSGSSSADKSSQSEVKANRRLCRIN